MFGIIVFILPLLVCSQTYGADVLKVSSFLVSPYLKYSESKNANTTGNDQYEGYIKDLLDVIMKNIGMEYEISLADGYGRQTANGWSGMIGDLVNNKTEIAAGPLTVTMLRETAVDFTYPFKKIEATGVMRKRHWNKKPQINEVDDFIGQDIIKLGTVKDGPIANDLKQSKLEHHKLLWETMKSHSLFMADNNEGIKRVKWDEDYVFFMESSTADLFVNRKPCEFVGIPGGFYKRQYALAVPNQSQLRDTINAAISELSKNGKMKEIDDKWMKGDDCSGTLALHSSQLLSKFLVVIILFRVLV